MDKARIEELAKKAKYFELERYLEVVTFAEGYKRVPSGVDRYSTVEEAEKAMVTTEADNFCKLYAVVADSEKSICERYCVGDSWYIARELAEHINKLAKEQVQER